MSAALARMLVFAVSAYAGLGILVGLPLTAFGLSRFDPAAKAAPWTFKLLVFPGVAALWPLILRRALAAKSDR